MSSQKQKKVKQILKIKIESFPLNLCPKGFDIKKLHGFEIPVANPTNLFGINKNKYQMDIESLAKNHGVKIYWNDFAEVIRCTDSNLYRELKNFLSDKVDDSLMPKSTFSLDYGFYSFIYSYKNKGGG